MNLYFNNAFARQPLREVVEEMQPYLRDEFENPLTESDGAGRAREVLASGRASVAALLNAKPEEIFFVSSGTEANNWALKGAVSANKKRHDLVISAIEHFSVLQTARSLQKQGAGLSVAPAGREGLVDPADVKKNIKTTTVLVSIQAASDEIGVVQDIGGISALKRLYPDVLFHCDAVQYLSAESLDVDQCPFDLVSLSSNALYGPPGIAALYVREGTRILPLLHGGMQEDGLRPGLQSMALVAGFGAAARINLARKSSWMRHLLSLRNRLFDCLDELNAPVTGSRTRRLADNVHTITDVDGEALLTLLLEKGICATSGSTCYQYAQKESHVLKALGMDPGAARGALLFTLGADQTEADIDFLAGSLQEILPYLRALKP
jgi:cysteine desulfurase